MGPVVRNQPSTKNTNKYHSSSWMEQEIGAGGAPLSLQPMPSLYLLLVLL
nr:hypothetical protein Q903MT_gene2658 [Picea sitchensis]